MDGWMANGESEDHKSNINNHPALLRVLCASVVNPLDRSRGTHYNDNRASRMYRSGTENSIGSENMKRDIVAKRAIQTVACGFGLLGLYCACYGFYSGVVGLRDFYRFEAILGAAVCLVLGGVLIAVAWKALSRFGPDVIQSVVALVTLSAWSLLPSIPEPSRPAEPRWLGGLLEMALVLGPLYLAILLYRILCRKLIQMTGRDIADHNASPATQGVNAS